MKKGNIFLGTICLIAMIFTGCGRNANSGTTDVKQESTQSTENTNMEETSPKGTDSTASENTTDPNSISEEKAREIALADAEVAEADVTGIRVEKDRDNGRDVYDVEFYAGDKEYDYEIDRTTGEIISRHYDIENDFSHDQNQPSDLISKEEAIRIALDKVEGATEENIRIELDEEDGHWKYDGEIHHNDKEYDFEIDAKTGEILEWSNEFINK